jgi:hypothetical protein
MLLEKEKRTMTLEETIKQATPLGGVYQHACPGGWTAYAAKSESGQFICQYVKDSDPPTVHSAVGSRMYEFVFATRPAAKKLKTWYVWKGVVTDLEAHDNWNGEPVKLGDPEWQFSDLPGNERTMSRDYLSLEQGLRDLSPAIFILEE